MEWVMPKKSEYLSVKISPSDKEELKELATSYGLLMSSFIILLIHNFADNPEWQKTFRLTRRKNGTKIQADEKQ